MGTFNEAYYRILETKYKEAPDQLKMLLALVNANNYRFQKIAPATDVITDRVQYNIQRTRRLKGSTIINPQNRSAQSQLDILDQHSVVEWDTLATEVAKLNFVGVRKSRFGERDALSIDWTGEVYNELIAQSTSNIIETRIEDVLTEFIQNTPAANFEALQTSDIWSQISLEALKIRVLRDEYKSTQSQKQVFACIHPEIEIPLAKEKGTLFRREAPVFETGLQASFSVNSTPVLICDLLNTFDVQVGGQNKRVAAIIFDRDAMAYNIDDLNENPLMTQIGTVEWYGRYFSDIYKLVDTKRVKIIYFDSAIEKTDGVNV